MNQLKDCLTSLVAVAAAVGMIVSVESVLTHYDIASSDFCSISETFNCDIVNKSAYSELFGIPVAALGFIAYLILFIGVLVYDRKPSKKLLDLLMMLAAGGVIFSLYLTSIEAFVLYTWCLVCLASQAAILVCAIGLWRLGKL